MALKEEEPDELNSLTESTEISQKESSGEIHHSTADSSMSSLKDVLDLPDTQTLPRTPKDDEDGIDNPTTSGSVLVTVEATRSSLSPSSPIPVPHCDVNKKKNDDNENVATSTPTSTQSRYDEYFIFVCVRCCATLFPYSVMNIIF